MYIASTCIERQGICRSKGGVWCLQGDRTDNRTKKHSQGHASWGLRLTLLPLLPLLPTTRLALEMGSSC